MITALDAPPDALDQQEQAFVGHIRASGWTRTEVFGDDEGPGFSYTTGFWLNTGQPEIVIFGLKSEIVHDVCWDLYHSAKAGKALSIGRLSDDVFGNLPAYAFPVDDRHYKDHLGWSMWFYSAANPFPCLQIVWPDRKGRFPWEQGFDSEFQGLQSDLSELGWQTSIAH